MTSYPSSSSHHDIPKPLKKFLQPVISRAAKIPASVYLVGGCVRDLFLKRPALDIDVVVEGPTEELAKSLAKTYKSKLVSHEAFLTHTLQLPKGNHLDIATARTETYPESAALPVVDTASLQEDLFRRDFSINAIALSLNENDFGHVWDPFDGLQDLRSKTIRVLHSDSFKDDPTRIFRAARFAGRFGYDVEWRTREWLGDAINAQLPAKLSGARLREELIPLLLEKDPRAALDLLSQWGALTFLIPNLKWTKAHDSFMGQVLKTKVKADPLFLRMVVLLHQVPMSKAVGSLAHLMFPQKFVQQVEQALTFLQLLREGKLTPQLAKAAKAKGLPSDVVSFLNQAVRMKSLFPKKRPVAEWRRFQDSTPCLSGRDILDLGYKPGPLFTRIFDALHQARWEGKLRTREEEIRFLRDAFPPSAE